MVRYVALCGFFTKLRFFHEAVLQRLCAASKVVLAELYREICYLTAIPYNTIKLKKMLVNLKIIHDKKKLPLAAALFLIYYGI